MFECTDVELSDLTIVDEAHAAIVAGELESARLLLEQVAARAPDSAKYVGSRTVDGVTLFRYWDEEDRALGEQAFESVSLPNEVVYLPTVYPKAYLFLAFVAFERNDNEVALHYLQTALQMDPLQHVIWIEGAAVASTQGLNEMANELLDRALACRIRHAPHTLARILRAKAVNEIELGNLEEAKKLLGKSLECEPESVLARQELFYIEWLESGGEPLKPQKTITSPYGGELSLPGTPGPAMTELLLGLQALVEMRVLTEEEYGSLEERLLGGVKARKPGDQLRWRAIVKSIALMHALAVDGRMPLDEYERKKSQMLEALCDPLQQPPRTADA